MKSKIIKEGLQRRQNSRELPGKDKTLSDSVLKEDTEPPWTQDMLTIVVARSLKKKNIYIQQATFFISYFKNRTFYLSENFSPSEKFPTLQFFESQEVLQSDASIGKWDPGVRSPPYVLSTPANSAT